MNTYTNFTTTTMCPKCRSFDVPCSGYGDEEVVGDCPHCPRIKTLAELIDWATMYLSLWGFEEEAEWRLRGKRSLIDLCERAIGRYVWQSEGGPECAALEQLMAHVEKLTPKEVQKMVQQALAVLNE